MCVPKRSAGCPRAVPIPSTALRLLPAPTQVSTRTREQLLLPPGGQRALCSQEGRGGQRRYTQTSRDSDDISSPQCQGWQLAWVLLRVHHCGWCYEGEEQRGPSSFVLPRGPNSCCSSASGTAGARDMPGAGARVVLLLQLLVHRGQAVPRH